MQAAAKSRLFPPTDMTTALVSLNRYMYAQLMQVRAGLNRELGVGVGAQVCRGAELHGR